MVPIGLHWIVYEHLIECDGVESHGLVRDLCMVALDGWSSIIIFAFGMFPSKSTMIK